MQSPEGASPLAGVWGQSPQLLTTLYALTITLQPHKSQWHNESLSHWQ
jgi:hypothetical protein